jgi:ppGpp synthetase/RelA/SpoT-type nucleotidyltranferase
MDTRSDYIAIKPSLDESARRLEDFLRSYMPDGIMIDRITARSKSVERFLGKAQKMEEGRPKYPNPILDVQDIIGARIVVLYLHEVEQLKRFIPTLLTLIEHKGLEPEGFSEFGYFGWHAIAHLPEEVRGTTADGIFPRFFEIQVKTVFQHAWAEAEHDLAYKEFRGPLTREDKRLIAFAAAQAWGADNSFEAVLRALKDRKAES